MLGVCLCYSLFKSFRKKKPTLTDATSNHKSKSLPLQSKQINCMIKNEGEKNAYLQCPIQCLKTPACLLKDRCLRQAMVSFFCKTIFPPSTLLRAKPSAASSFRCLELPSKLIFLRVLEGNAQDSMSCQLRPQPIGFLGIGK